MTPSTLDACLRPSEFFDCDSPEVRERAARIARESADDREAAVLLFYSIRDGIRYEMYRADLSRAGMRASAILRAGSGFCMHKCIAYVACARALGIPARIAFSDVRNHLCTGRLRELVGGDVFHHHATAEIWLDGRWIKTTPVFNRLLCALFRMTPLEFDGVNDATLHAFDDRGHSHMEFLADHGSHAEFPYEECLRSLATFHPMLLRGSQTVDGSLQRERVLEIGSVRTLIA
jgi:hypothetical protein